MTTHTTKQLVAILVPTLIAAAAITVFALFSVGPTLLVTFVPAMGLAWLLYMVRTRNGPLPDRKRFTPVFLIAMGVQLLHFAEEYATDFPSRWPREMFGVGHGYDVDVFVGFNLAAYVVFLAAFVGTVRLGYRTPAVVLWFVVLMMALGNAVLHPIWALKAGGYFPGLYTSLAYWILGPILVVRMWNPGATRS